MLEQKQDELAAISSAMGATKGCLSVQLSTVQINGVPEQCVLNLQPQTVISNLLGMTVGVDLGQLLLQALDYIFGVAYPLTVSERHNDQQLARKTLHGGIIKRAFTGQCWLMARLLF